MDGWSATHARGATLGSRRRPLPLDMCGRLAAAAPCSAAAHMARRGRSRVAVTGRLGRRWVHPSVRGVLVENVQRRGGRLLGAHWHILGWRIWAAESDAANTSHMVRHCIVRRQTGGRCAGPAVPQSQRRRWRWRWRWRGRWRRRRMQGPSAATAAGGEPAQVRPRAGLGQTSTRLNTPHHRQPTGCRIHHLRPTVVCCTNNHSPRSRPTRPPLVPPPPQIADQTMQFPRQRSVSRVMACFRPVLRARLAEHVTA